MPHTTRASLNKRAGHSNVKETKNGGNDQAQLNQQIQHKCRKADSDDFVSGSNVVDKEPLSELDQASGGEGQARAAIRPSPSPVSRKVKNRPCVIHAKFEEENNVVDVKVE